MYRERERKSELYKHMFTYIMRLCTNKIKYAINTAKRNII